MMVRSLVGSEIVSCIVMRKVPIDFDKIDTWLSSLQSVTVHGANTVPSVNKGQLNMAFVLKYSDKQ